MNEIFRIATVSGAADLWLGEGERNANDGDDDVAEVKKDACKLLLVRKIALKRPREADRSLDVDAVHRDNDEEDARGNVVAAGDLVQLCAPGAACPMKRSSTKANTEPSQAHGDVVWAARGALNR